MLATVVIRGESRRIERLCRLQGSSAANLGETEHGAAAVGYGLVGLDAALGAVHAYRMPRARSPVRDLLLAIAAMASALLRGDALHSVLGLLRDALRARTELLAENALLRQQLLVLRRQVARPRIAIADRWWMVMAARVATAWREALLVVQPATLLHWHRELYRGWWRRTTRARPPKSPSIPADTITLIREIAKANRLWGAERIQGELLKLGLQVCKRTVQKYMRGARPRSPSGPRWSTFLREHAKELWACDFLQLYDTFFRPIFAFFLVEHGSRRVIQVGVTRAPSDAWVAQQLRNATPDGSGPRFLLRDRDSKYGQVFDRVAAGVGARVIRTPVLAPRANAICERFLGSVRRECLDHILVLGERHLERVLTEYARYFNDERPHQGIGQKLPAGSDLPANTNGRVVKRPVLGGLHHAYRRAA